MRPVRTTILDDYEIDVAGVKAVLARFDDRIELVDGSGPSEDVDVILYGVREDRPGHDVQLHRLLRDQPATVIALNWGPDAPQVQWAVSCGAHGVLSKTMSGQDIVAGVEEIHRRRLPGDELPQDGPCHPGLLAVGLTPRELEVLAFVTQGLTNQEIAETIYVSINSVKTYIRTAYRKVDVCRRSQAVSWGIRHGLDVSDGSAEELMAPA